MVLWTVSLITSRGHDEKQYANIQDGRPVPIAPINIEGLSVTYRDTEVLSGITCKVSAGDYVGIVGPNGSGKTTFIRAILGLVPAAQGRVQLFGTEISAFTSWGKIGYLPQRVAHLDPRFPANVEEVVMAGLIASRPYPKRTRPGDRERVFETLQEFGIADLAGCMIGRLSGGQQQRVLLARALVHHPDLLLLDEPVTALDPSTREHFYTRLEQVNKDRGTTILFISHDISVMGKYASKFLYLDKKIVFYGTFDAFCHSPEMGTHFGAGQHLICHRHG